LPRIQETFVNFKSTYFNSHLHSTLLILEISVDFSGTITYRAVNFISHFG